jgi:hypothetical protein
MEINGKYLHVFYSFLKNVTSICNSRLSKYKKYMYVVKEESGSTDNSQLRVCQVARLVFAGANACKFHKTAVTKTELTTSRRLK